MPDPTKHSDYLIKLGADLGKAIEEQALLRRIKPTALIRIVMSEWLMAKQPLLDHPIVKESEVEVQDANTETEDIPTTD
jgi:hypothetical protein